MDYDDNDFQSQNLHLAGEASNKFPPVLRPFALPKFDFDDSLHGSLRFDSLVETEVFLGIESNEDSQWIEDYSRGTSGIQFSSSAAESCTILRRNNVWSEATSSESVEMLLKSVGQEEPIPAQTNIKESDACDELGCIIKHMEPSLKQDSERPTSVGDVAGLQPTSLLGAIPGNFSVSDEGGMQQTHLEDRSQTHRQEALADESLGDLTAINVKDRLPGDEENSVTDAKHNVVNQREVDTAVFEHIDTTTSEHPGVGAHVDSAVTAMQSLASVDGVLNDGTDSNHVTKTAGENSDVLVADNPEPQPKEGALGEGQRHDQVMIAERAGSGDPDASNPPCTASVESVEEAGTIENEFIVEGRSLTSKVDSGLETCDQQPDIDAHEVPLAICGNSTTIKNEHKASILGMSPLSVEDKKSSQDEVVGSCSGYGAVSYSLPEASFSVELVKEIHANSHIWSYTPVESAQTCEKIVGPAQGDVGKDVSVQEKDKTNLPSDGNNMVRIIDKVVVTSSEGSTEKESIVSKSQTERSVVSESVDGVLMPSVNSSNADAVDHKNVEVSPLPEACSHADKEQKISVQVSAEASLTDHRAASQVTTDIHFPSADDLETQGAPQAVDVEEASEECTKDKEACPAPCTLAANWGDGAKAAGKENDEKKAINVSELTVNTEMRGSEPSAMSDCHDNCQIVQEVPSVSEPADACFDGTAVLNSDRLGSGTTPDESVKGSPIVSRTGVSKNQAKQSADQSVPVSEETGAIKVPSASKGLNCNNSSKDDSSFTFEVTPLADLPQKDAKNLPMFSNVEVGKASQVVDRSTSNSGFGQLDLKISQDISCGSPKFCDVATPRTASRGSSERKPRRAPGKVTPKETVKKGKPIKENPSMRLERGERTTVSMSSPGVCPLMQSGDTRQYGHMGSSGVKPFVLATSTSGLPDLNSSISQSALYQQLFTDLQQVQLRAQIFVYGALIQGTAPDEAYMISAFGGPDGGRSIWENAWRSCIERLNGQKSHIVTPETPIQSHSGSRATEQLTKQSAIQTKLESSPISRGGNKGTPLVNPIVPFSSPLWSMPTSSDSLQSSGMPKVPVMDYQRALSPLNPHHAAPIRNFVGHSPSWLSQSPFGVPWFASPPTSAIDTSGRFSVQYPITEPVQLIPPKESSISHSSVALPSIPVVQSTASTSVFPLPSVLDVKTVTASVGQSSADPKPRKRKKTPANENPRQIFLPPIPQIEPVIASVAVATSVGFVSKAPTEKFITSPTPMSSAGLSKGQNLESGHVLSEDSLGNVTEARVQAEVAAAHAASAVGHSQEIWNQLDKQINCGLPDAEAKLASAAVSVAAAAAVAKAAAAAAMVASNAALQAKLMAEEAFVSIDQSRVTHFPDGMKNLGKATPASILKGDDGTNSSSSILVAAREAARRRVEAASAASKRAENMDAIVKAAELAAEAVSQAGRIVAMGDPVPLSELIATGPEGYWKVTEGASELVLRTDNIGRETVNLANTEVLDASRRQLKEVPSIEKENQMTNQSKSPAPRAPPSNEDHNKTVHGIPDSKATITKDRGQKARKASGSGKVVEVTPEPQNGSTSPTVENTNGLKEHILKEDSIVEVFKDGSGFKAAWFSAKVLNLKDGNALVSYTDLTLGEGSETLKEWVPLEGEGDEAPKIRIARPTSVIPFKGTRKRRRAAMGEYNWSVGDRVDAWMRDSWWEGVITENGQTDESVLVNFPAQGETSLVSKWNLRPSLIWRDGKWIEWPSLWNNTSSSHAGDTPQEKRPRVRSPTVEVEGKDKSSRTVDVRESDRPDNPILLALSADEKLFNVGKSASDGNKADGLRMTRTGLQKEGSKVIFGVPKPGKKRKFMEVSKHYVAGRSDQTSEANDSVKFTKYLMPQGTGSRGWKSTSRTEASEKRAAISNKPKLPKSGKPHLSGRTISQKENLTSASVSFSDDSLLADHIPKNKDSLDRSENASENGNRVGFKSFSTPDGATEGPILFSSLPLPSDNISSKKMPLTKVKPERTSKGKFAPADGKFDKTEGKSSTGNSAKSSSEQVEPRRSNRRIQPTSRLLEGLQSSLMVSKIPSVSHDKSHKNKNVSKGNSNHG